MQEWVRLLLDFGLIFAIICFALQQLQLINWPAIQPINAPTKQRTNLPNNQPINQPIS
jgi:hypothetical protein